jgi:hypothetical protein
MDRAIERFAPLAGVAFVVFLLAGVFVGGEAPDVGDPASDVADFYVDKSTQLRITTVLLVIAMFALILFASRLTAILKRDGGSATMATTAFGGALIAAGGIGVDAALRFTLVEAAGDVSEEALEGVFALWSSHFLTIHFGFAIFTLAACICALDSKTLPIWIVGLGIIGAVLLVIPVIAIALIGLIPTLLWVIITSVLLFRQPVPATP